MKPSIFERFPKITLILLISFACIASIILLELFASRLFGLGKTILYEANPIFGYRPKANQIVARKPAQRIQINNLSLRAEQDWDDDFSRKILFLGDSVTYGGSYIDNRQLFSYLAGKHFPQWDSGNAGVNAWGINNVHALIVETDFLPAQVYVSIFPEGDFYRGHMRLGGQPFWTKKPVCALDELFHYFVYKLHLIKTPTPNFGRWPEEERLGVAEIAVRHLKEMDEFLISQNRDHLIYITPSRSHLLGSEKKDPVLQMLFAQYQLPVIYLQDRIGKLDPEDIAALYHDEIHLSTQGHTLWAKLITPELDKIIHYRESDSLLAYAK